MKIRGAREEAYRIEWKVEEKAKGDIDQSGRRARNESSYLNHYIELFQCFLVLYKVEEKKEYRRKWEKVCEMEHVIGEERGNKEEKGGLKKKEELERAMKGGSTHLKMITMEMKQNAESIPIKWTMQFTVRYGTVRYGTVRYSTIQH